MGNQLGTRHPGSITPKDIADAMQALAPNYVQFASGVENNAICGLFLFFYRNNPVVKAELFHELHVNGQIHKRILKFHWVVAANEWVRKYGRPEDKYDAWFTGITAVAMGGLERAIDPPILDVEIEIAHAVPFTPTTIETRTPSREGTTVRRRPGAEERRCLAAAQEPRREQRLPLHTNQSNSNNRQRDTTTADV